MSRIIVLNGIKCQVSKSEAIEAETLRQHLSHPQSAPGYVQARFNRWMAASSSPAMRERRLNVGKALNLQW